MTIRYLLLCVCTIILLFPCSGAASENYVHECDKVCIQAADLFWDVYTSSTSKNKSIDSDSTFLSKYNEVPRSIGIKIIDFAKHTNAKYGNQLVNHKDQLIDIARDNCLKSCEDAKGEYESE
ncbi:hypothetical protein [Geomonas agri]|uniref:hypothetical protein n=1 Tax=Geomonas agri TaxID=2873702 RepID=UPI001CD79115|nr:hypothetical protein [Geomonas agri]